VGFREVWGYFLGCLRESLGVLVKHFIKRFWEGVIKFFLELLSEYLGACANIFLGLLGGLREGLYWYAIVLTYRRFHGGLAEFSKGLSGVC
jgi:hypothetical protein